MPLGDIFRSFFGLDRPPDNHGRPFHDSDTFSEDDEADDGMADIFHHFHGGMQQQMSQLQREMEEMFKGFGVVDFSSTGIDLPTNDDERHSTRDKMLKEPNSNHGNDGPEMPHRDQRITIFPQNPSLFGGMFHGSVWGRVKPQEKVDGDLDDQVDSSDVSRFFDRPQYRRPNHFQSSHRSVTISTFRNSDGRIEKKRTERDSEGNETTTLSRHLGEKSHTVKIHENGSGRQNKNETFTNMDEKDLPNFESDWNKSRQQPNTGILPPPHPEGSNLDKNIPIVKRNLSDWSFLKQYFDFDKKK